MAPAGPGRRRWRGRGGGWGGGGGELGGSTMAGSAGVSVTAGGSKTLTAADETGW